MKKRCLKFLYLLLGLAVVVACSKDEEVFTGNIMGKVTNAVTGEVLQGVVVTISPTGLSQTTGSNGYFEFLDLEPRQYEIQARKSGYVTNNKSVTVVTGRDAQGDIQITPIVQDGKLELSVSSLNFGNKNTSLSFDIRNKGNKSLNWNISGLDKIDWFSINPTMGTLAAGKSNAVTVTLNRDLITENKEAVIIVNADNESLSLKITAEVENKSSKIVLNTNTLNFGTEYTSLSFDVKNAGNSGDVNWEITDIDVDWLKVSPMTGTTAIGKSSAVKVLLDRSKLPEGKHTTTFLVNADGESLRVTVNAEKSQERYLEVNPSALVLGTAESATLTIISHNGPTAYELYGDGDFSWARFDKVEGVIPEYDSADASTIEKITITADREGVAAGEYSFTLIIRSDLEDYNVPVTMTVEKDDNGEDIPSGDEVAVPYGLYTYYKFEDNFDDSSENMLNGFGSNSPSFVEGITPESKAVKFSKTNNSSFVVPKPIIDSRMMSISFWGKNFADGNIFYMVSNQQSQPMFTLSMSGGQLKFIVTRYNNGYQYGNKGTFMHPTLTDGKWHHIVLTTDFNKTTYATITTTLYVDGQAVDVITEDANPFSEDGYSQSSYDTGTKFIMGGSVKLSYSNTLSGTNMSVDNFRVYDTRLLSSDEVQTIFKAKQ